MTPDDKIAAFLGSARPASEPSFNAAVMKAIARRELERSLLVAALGAVVGGLVLWAVAPVLGAKCSEIRITRLLWVSALAWVKAATPAQSCAARSPSRP
jgi:hypothetical protein